jgi:hypothetical protein
MLIIHFEYFCIVGIGLLSFMFVSYFLTLRGFHEMVSLMSSHVKSEHFYVLFWFIHLTYLKGKFNRSIYIYIYIYICDSFSTKTEKQWRSIFSLHRHYACYYLIDISIHWLVIHWIMYKDFRGVQRLHVRQLLRLLCKAGCVTVCY